MHERLAPRVSLFKLSLGASFAPAPAPGARRSRKPKGTTGSQDGSHATAAMNHEETICDRLSGSADAAAAAADSWRRRRRRGSGGSQAVEEDQQLEATKVRRRRWRHRKLCYSFSSRDVTQKRSYANSASSWASPRTLTAILLVIPVMLHSGELN